MFNHYDVDHSGSLEFGEFLKGLRVSQSHICSSSINCHDSYVLGCSQSRLTPQRRALVEQAFLAMDTNKSGEIDFEDLKSVYDTRHHPKVQSGQWTAKQAIDEFIGIFEGDKGDGNKSVTKTEWLDYHTGLSANIDTDDEFGILMSKNWGIEYIPKKNIDALFEIIKEKSEAKSGKKTPKRTAEDIFKFFDKNGSKQIDRQEFNEAMGSFGAALNEKELTTLFRMFDHDGSGEISYQELVDLIWGEGK